VRRATSAGLAVFLATGCSASSPTSASKGSITVFAASSLSKAFTQLGADFEAQHTGTKVTFSFAASSALAQQVLAGAPADVFASASPRNMKQVTDAGDASDPKTFAHNVAEIAAAPGSAVTDLADLSRPGLKVALCDSSVPCGALADQVLRNAHVTVRPVTRGVDVASTLAAVANGSADAAIVYVTDVRAAGNKVTGIPIPAAVNASTAYEIATVKGSHDTALAEAFEQLVLSAEGQATLATAGFQRP
jgi:molybdate transport system substrate-binding protein